MNAWGMNENHYPDQTKVWNIINGRKVNQNADKDSSLYGGVSLASMWLATYDSLLGGLFRGFRSAYNRHEPELPKKLDEGTPYQPSAMPESRPAAAPAVKPYEREAVQKKEAGKDKAEEAARKIQEYSSPAKIYEGMGNGGDVYIVLDNIGCNNGNNNGIGNVWGDGDPDIEIANSLGLFDPARRPYPEDNPYHW